MDVFEAIESRRTVKAFAPNALAQAELEPLFAAARWAPNHKLTEPWRFRVVGSESLTRLKQAAAELAADAAPDGADAEVIGTVAAKKLDRAPTLVVVSSVQNADPTLDDEDRAATAIAAYIVLLTAHARGFVGYWRTPEALRSAAGLAAVGIEPGEHVLGLLHLGHAQGEPPATPARTDTADFVSYLD